MEFEFVIDDYAPRALYRVDLALYKIIRIINNIITSMIKPV